LYQPWYKSAGVNVESSASARRNSRSAPGQSQSKNSGELRAAGGARDAEVGDEGVPARQQDVLGLHVAVHDAVAVRVPQGVRRLGLDREGVLERQRTFPGQAIAQRLAFDVGHDVVEEPAGIAGVVQRENGGMLQSGGDADFAQEPLAPEGGGELRPEALAPGGRSRRAELSLDAVPRQRGAQDLLRWCGKASSDVMS
jgi:hypothetical protein